MKIKNILIITLVLAVLFTIAGCRDDSQKSEISQSTENKKQIYNEQIQDGIDIIKLNDVKEDTSKIYEADYQTDKKSQIDILKKKRKYTMKSPLLVENPYGTISNGLYIYFRTKGKRSFEYKVSTKGYPDFEAKLNNGGVNNLSTEHEYMLLGAIPGEENTITLYKVNKKGKRVRSVKFIFVPEKIKNDYGYQKQVEDGKSKQKLSNGLYVMFRNDITKGSGGICTVMFDNEGVVRCIIPIINYRTNRLLFDKKGMYLEVSRNKIVRMESTGYVNRIYSTGIYDLHHDMIFGKKNDLLVCATTRGSDVEEDMIISVNLESGKVTEFIDMKKLLSDYYDNAVWGDYRGTLDWIHINSLAFTSDGGLLISGRETSTIIKVKEPYKTKDVDYLIGSKNFYKETAYKTKVLKKIGKFSLQGGQHSLQVINDNSLKNDQYYLVLYNNNYTNSTYGATLYNWRNDKNYYNQGFTKSGKGEDVVSYYYKYLVDEKRRTVKLVDSIDVTYSSILSSAQVYQENIITLSGNPHVVNEFDSEGKLIRRFISPSKGYTYRCYKYDFEKFWFYNK